MELATDKQIAYLVKLANKVERMKKSTIGEIQEVHYVDWNVECSKGVTVADASIRIDAYRQIIRLANTIRMLCGQKQR